MCQITSLSISTFSLRSAHPFPSLAPFREAVYYCNLAKAFGVFRDRYFHCWKFWNVLFSNMDFIKQLNGVFNVVHHNHTPWSTPNKMHWDLSYMYLFGMPVIYLCIPPLTYHLRGHNFYQFYYKKCDTMVGKTSSDAWVGRNSSDNLQKWYACIQLVRRVHEAFFPCHEILC